MNDEQKKNTLEAREHLSKIVTEAIGLIAKRCKEAYPDPDPNAWMLMSRVVCCIFANHFKMSLGSVEEKIK